MSEMFKNMQEVRRLSGDNIPEFLLLTQLQPEESLNLEKEHVNIQAQVQLIVLTFN